MNYPMFALLAIMFVAYVCFKRSNKHKRRHKSGNEKDQRIQQLEDEIKRLKEKES